MKRPALNEGSKLDEKWSSANLNSSSSKSNGTDGFDYGLPQFLPVLSKLYRFTVIRPTLREGTALRYERL